MRFTWHEAKREANLREHGLDFVDAREVFEGATFTYEDSRFAYDELRFVTLGLERAGVIETRRGVGTFIAARTPFAQEETLRRTELNRAVDRFLAELSHQGFSVEDALPEIERRRQQGA